MDCLVMRLQHVCDDIRCEVVIVRGDQERVLDTIYGVDLKDAEWLILANTSEHTTPWHTEVL